MSTDAVARQQDVRARVASELERSRALGFLGPRPVTAQIEHALGFAESCEEVPTKALDLGSGGGVPGLVLAAMAWREARVVLLDANERRCAFLRQALERLELEGRVDVVRGRAEELARHPELRGRFDAVVSRSFGAPAVTAECAAPFLRVGGRLVVSEPPADDAPDRWPAEGIAQLGLRRTPVSNADHHFAAFVQDEVCRDRFPRRTGLPAKRPLF